MNLHNISCEIEWNSLSLDEWDKTFASCQRTSLLQSYDYGYTMATINQQKPRWGLIKINGEHAGLVQILEAGVLGNLIHAVLLDMGPVWLKGFGSAAHLHAFFTEFNRQFPRRFGRKRRILPSIEQSDSATKLFEKLGFKPKPTPSYQTVWLDLRPGLDTLRAGLKSKWRNSLNKAEKSNLKIEWDDTTEHLSWLITEYNADRAIKNYDGVSAKTLRALAHNFKRNQNVIIARAVLDKLPVAAIMVFIHGSSATYQISWTSEDGKKHAAHNLLLWSSFQYLKEHGITDFDLGGINDETAKGVKKFKEGIGGQSTTYLGHYF